MGGVTDGKMLAFGGVGVQLPIFGPDSAAVKGVLNEVTFFLMKTYVNIVRASKEVV